MDNQNIQHQQQIADRGSVYDMGVNYEISVWSEQPANTGIGEYERYRLINIRRDSLDKYWNVGDIF